MTEQTLTRQARGRPGPDSIDDDVEAAGQAEVAAGLYHDRLPVVGMTVAEIRASFGDRLDIHPNAVAVLDGERVSDETRVGPRQRLAFVRFSGEKGRGRS